jgi:hypothetical protein
VLDLTVETPLPLADACKYVPPGRGGRKTHLSTLVRWSTHGAKAPSGELIRLEALRLGNRWMTSRQALQRFAELLTPCVEDTSTFAAPRTSTQRQRAAERAGRELAQIGI